MNVVEMGEHWLGRKALAGFQNVGCDWLFIPCEVPEKDFEIQTVL